MKKFIFMGVIGLFLLGSCNSKSGEGHNHETPMRDMITKVMTMRAKTMTMSTKEPATSTSMLRKLPPAIATKSYCLRLRRRPPVWRRASSNRVLSIR